jgi:hypothetical protein
MSHPLLTLQAVRYVYVTPVTRFPLPLRAASFWEALARDTNLVTNILF